MKVCTETQLRCVEDISVTRTDCPVGCSGIIVGVRKDPVARRHSAGFDELLKDYGDYKCNNYTDLSFDHQIRGGGRSMIRL